MNRWKSVLAGLILAALVSCCGCSEEVITVADISGDETSSQRYIEMKEFELKERDDGSGREKVKCCVVKIPSGYHESEEIPGMYLHERAPLDSSNIYYSVSPGSEKGMVSDSLTQEEYAQTIESAFQDRGQKVELAISSFEELDMDGIPGYKIRSEYMAGEHTIQQLTYLVLAEDTYTITYSQSQDDELMADFEISDGEIKLVREEKLEMANK